MSPPVALEPLDGTVRVREVPGAAGAPAYFQVVCERCDSVVAVVFNGAVAGAVRDLHLREAVHLRK